MKLPLIWFILLIGVVPPNAHALKTGYLTFDHPDGWRCERSEGIWICQSSVETDRKESVILSIATLATEWDSLDSYLEYLKQPRTIQDGSGRALAATVSYVRKRNINGTWWVDSLQQNSELPGFYARYLATVSDSNKVKLAILVTYIVSKERYEALAPIFDRVIASVKLNSEFDLNIASMQGDGPIPGSERLGPAQQKILLERLNVKRPLPGAGSELPKIDLEDDSSSSMIWLIPAGGAIILLVLAMRIRKKRQLAKTKSVAASTKPKEPTVNKKAG